MFNNNVKTRKILKANSELELKKLINANLDRWEVKGDIKFIAENFYNPFQVLMVYKK